MSSADEARLTKANVAATAVLMIFTLIYFYPNYFSVEIAFLTFALHANINFCGSYAHR
jgi:hypothetical protein